MKLLRALIPLLMVALMLVGLAPQSASAAMPNFQMPVPCGETWSGMTNQNNWRYNAMYLNRANDLGDTVVAAASGTVKVSEDSMWGKSVTISHPEVAGVATVYSHLLGVSVQNGQYVQQGQKIGYVGATGSNVTEPVLGYEVQWFAGMMLSVKATFDGTEALYYGTQDYTSKNSCGNTAPSTAVVNTAGLDPNVRSGPGAAYNVVAPATNGQTVTIECQTKGALTSGPYGTTNLWNKIGPDQYISDAYTYLTTGAKYPTRCGL